uniref:uncharacterized protein LOC122608824 n=1 Tax=Erigeron canadensis TaxID=72917 RepID=UPI001CB9CE6A|nr:uncharacterized protein LOC122608824 [Erigeron canadensis]
MTNTRRQDVENTLKNHEKSITEIQTALAAMMKQQEESVLQQQEILKAVQEKSVHASSGSSGGGGTGSGSHSFFSDAESRGNRPMRIGKVEFPKFSDEDVDAWVYRCEHFFTIDETPEAMKLRYSVIHLEGDAIQWHRAFMRTRGATVAEISWNDYIRSIKTCFSNAVFEDPLEELASLSQTGSLHELNTTFDSLLNKVNLTESQAMSLYLKALKPDIRGPVKMFKPSTLHEAYGLAKIQALNNENLVGKLKTAKEDAGSSRVNTNTKITPPTNATKLPLLPTPNRSTTTTSNPTSNTCRLTSKELEHKQEDGEEGIEELSADGEKEQQPQISIHALTGIPSYPTMRVAGSNGNRQLHILIDSGSTHNFLKDRLAKKLQCDVREVSPLNVGVADGERLISNQICHDFRWNMQGSWFTTQVLLLSLESYDMILGVQWLLPLNDILWNFQKMTMKFEVEGRHYELKGLQNNLFSVCSIEKMGELLNKHAKGGELQLFSLQLTNEGPGNNYQSRVPTGLPPSQAFDHKIKWKEGTKPISQRPYRYPAVQKDVIEKTTRELLDSGVIQNSQSSFAAPVVLVKKKDGQWRMCMDYRQLNEATVKDKFPIPLIEELLDELGGASIFSKLDLRSGYHQVQMAPEDVPKTAFRTHEGHYEFLVMSFGLTNAPATFQALMNHIFRPMLRKGVLVFFDDILVYSQNREDHIRHLEQVLLIMQENKLFAKESKCVFGGRAVEYLGHITSKEGVKTDPARIEAVQQWPTPKTIKQLRGFLGLAGYYRRFIRSFGLIAKPLTDLLKKDAFRWSNEAQDAFERLKGALSSAPVLALPYYSKVVVETDASTGGVRAVLMQDRHPIAFLSRALSSTQNALSVYEKELLAIMMAVKQWHYFLITGPFIIRSQASSYSKGVESKLSTAYHPQTDGQNEVVNRCLEGYLRCMVMERPHTWVKWVSLAEWWYNTTFHSSLGRTPFDALYGYRPPLHIPYILKDAVDKDVDEMMKDREAAVKVMKQSLLKAQNRMKQQADKHRSERSFEPGLWVYLKLQPYMQNSLWVHKHSKLTPKYFGPFLIVEKVGSVAYKLDLPEEAQIHPVFHVSLLKGADEPPSKVIPLPREACFTLQPQSILDRKLVKRGNRAAMKVLVHWKGQLMQDATWEFLHDLKLRFPDFDELTVEDKSG